MTGTKCTRELAPGNVTWGEVVNLALACSEQFGTESLEKIRDSLICCLLAFRPLKAGTARNFLAGPGKALVLRKTEQLSNTLVNALHPHRVTSPAARPLHTILPPDRSPGAAHANSPASWSAASCTRSTLGCESTKPKAVFPLASGDRRPKYQRGGAMPAACTTGCSLPPGTGSVAQAHSAGKARDAEPQQAGHSSLTAPARTLGCSSPSPSSTTDLCLVQLPAGRSGWVPPHPSYHCENSQAGSLAKLQANSTPCPASLSLGTGEP